MPRPLAVDLFTGLHGWAEGLVAEGWRVRGYDIEDMCAAVGAPRPEHVELVVRDVLTIHGSEVADAGLLVASPPCQFFSYTAMPWTKAKERAARTRADPALLERELALFNACFRIQREANEVRAAKGLPPIPMVVENVRGAQPWVGRAAANFGSYYLWGDVPALMPQPTDARKVPGFRFDGSGGSFQTASVERHLEGRKNAGGSWFNIGSPGQKEVAQNPVHAYVAEGRKHHGDWFRDPACPSRQCGQLKPPARVSEEPPAEGRKGVGAGAAWFDQNTSSLPSNSSRRKAASAKIAKIPLALSSHIARVYRP